MDDGYVAEGSFEEDGRRVNDNDLYSALKSSKEMLGVFLFRIDNVKCVSNSVLLWKHTFLSILTVLSQTACGFALYNLLLVLLTKWKSANV